MFFCRLFLMSKRFINRMWHLYIDMCGGYVYQHYIWFFIGINVLHLNGVEMKNSKWQHPFSIWWTYFCCWIFSACFSFGLCFHSKQKSLIFLFLFVHNPRFGVRVCEHINLFTESMVITLCTDYVDFLLHFSFSIWPIIDVYPRFFCADQTIIIQDAFIKLIFSKLKCFI